MIYYIIVKRGSLRSDSNKICRKIQIEEVDRIFPLGEIPTDLIEVFSI